MAVIRAEEKVNFTVISNEIIENPNLTAEATGMLIYMLSKPAEWVFNKSHLQTAKLKCGKDKLTRIFKELEQEGYLKKILQQDKSGKFSGVDWIVSSKKDNLKSPEAEKPATVKPDDGKTATSKNRIIVNTEYSNISCDNDFEIFFDELWKSYPKRKGNGKAATKRVVKQRLKEGHSKDDLLKGAESYKKFVEHEGRQENYIKMAQTFFGRDLHFKDDYEIKGKPNYSRPNNSIASRLANEVYEEEQSDSFVIDSTCKRLN